MNHQPVRQSIRPSYIAEGDVTNREGWLAWRVAGPMASGRKRPALATNISIRRLYSRILASILYILYGIGYLKYR